MTNPTPSEFDAKLDTLINKFASYCACDEYHYGELDGQPGNHDPTDGHMEFDEESLKAAIRAAVREVVPKPRKLYEPVTKREVKEGGKAMIDLKKDQRGSLVFIQDNGFNAAIAEMLAGIGGDDEPAR